MAEALFSLMGNVHNLFFSEKMTPHDMSTPTSPVMDPEEIRMRKMNRRSKVIQELVQTEKDYLTDLELCIREVVQPLRNLQVNADCHNFYPPPTCLHDNQPM